MTKAEWIRRVCEALPGQASNAEVERTLDAFVSVATAELLGGGEVPMPGLGKLKVKTTLARKGRNPRTGETIDIPAGQKVVFAAGKELKHALKG